MHACNGTNDVCRIHICMPTSCIAALLPCWLVLPHLPRETILRLLGGATELEARTATYIFIRLLVYNSSMTQPALLVTCEHAFTRPPGG